MELESLTSPAECTLADVSRRFNLPYARLQFAALKLGLSPAKTIGGLKLFGNDDVDLIIRTVASVDAHKTPEVKA